MKKVGKALSKREREIAAGKRYDTVAAQRPKKPLKRP